VIESSPSPYVDYVYYEPSVSSFVWYEPSVSTWTEYYETIGSPVYWYDESTLTYILESESPSPYVDYYTYNESLDSYSYYAPTPITDTTSCYIAPVVY